MQSNMSNNQDNNQLGSLRRRNSGSVLQMIQTLEIRSKGSKKRKLPSSSTDPNASRVLRRATRCVSPIVDDDSDCSDDDSFVSATSKLSTFTNSFKFDAPRFEDKPFEINFATPTPKLKPIRSSSCPELSLSRRSRRSSRPDTNFNFSDDDDLVAQIEAMAAQVETAFERRHFKKSKRVLSYEHLPEDYTPIKKSLSPDPLQLIRPNSKTCQQEDGMPEMESLLDCSYDSLESIDSVSSVSMTSKRPTHMMRNEEWSNPTPTKGPSTLLQRMEQRFGDSLDVSSPNKSNAPSTSMQHMLTSLRGLVL